MKKGKWTQVIWVLLAAFSLFSLAMLIDAGPRIIGKSYENTEEFKSDTRFFMDNIGPYVLNPLDPEKAKKEIRVSPDEIEAHRYEYGDLDEQIESIRMQYEDRIAKTEDKDEKAALAEERERKMDDIRKNFSDDEHVAKKIRVEKSKAIDQYMYRLADNKISFKETTRAFAYALTDTATGATSQRGNIQESTAYLWDFH